jgi:hypothetical protein
VAETGRDARPHHKQIDKNDTKFQLNRHYSAGSEQARKDWAARVKAADKFIRSSP